MRPGLFMTVVTPILTVGGPASAEVERVEITSRSILAEGIAFDDDGNGVGGIRLPELEAPLGTSQGFNPRHPDFGNPDVKTRFDGPFWPLPGTETDRRRRRDTRNPIETRYPSKEGWVAAVARAVEDLVDQRFLPPGGGDVYLQQARQPAWPPEPVDRLPFWRLRATED